ncbi:unnamed protein product, partial [Darwinula stevensoni]
PQTKKQKEEKKFQDSLKQGQKVVTTSGIHGRITQVNDVTVVVDTGTGKITFEKIIGLTGGIGSGKSTAAKIFNQKGIPVYNSDDRAKYLMQHSPELKKSIQSLLGVEAYQENGELNRSFISNKIFLDKTLLQKMNELVHPAVFEDSENWKNKQKEAPFLLREAAILFESGAFLLCDAIISVVADENIRIERTIKRDGLTQIEVQNRINNQWTDSQRIEKSD